ncbi:galactonate dehydratase [Natrialba asiatica]|uniref:Mandelate racemase/muconate lactonizing protein n=1 Tax=Natrialba asiatica (strain ATCC 700177 / DSM 12278 / JCM 9576 / FERM P-10747 / NBRC 102637 / 172P1) TaxID=29540 RepID=M0B3B5_NATA1|nr:galactonate dehydratase [Natrialba asiatica]ELZ05401.1 mandelate racemase/muconate lactonizing protein [Natrialba asiatica DSM 12278]
MEITGYELFEVPPRWLFLKLETDTGLVGWGEPIVEGRAQTVRTAVEEILTSYLLGKDPHNIEDHWQAMYRGCFYRGGPVLMSAIAGIDQALWDIKGKHFDIPVYELLGGRTRDRIRVYQWIGGDRVSEIGTEAKQLLEAGYTALKMDASNQLRHLEPPRAITDIVDRVRHVRSVVGDEMDVVVDFRGRISKSLAKRVITALEPFDTLFVEEPVLPENLEYIPELAGRTDVPLATGERLYSRWDFKPLFKRGGIDVIQPDVSHAGGISELVRLAAMAETHDIAVAPNCPLGPIALAASLQVSTYIPNLLIQDHGFDIYPAPKSAADHYLHDASVFEFTDGYLSPLDGPGLGVNIDESAVRNRSRQDLDWSNPIWRHEDGSIAEW